MTDTYDAAQTGAFLRWLSKSKTQGLLHRKQKAVSKKEIPAEIAGYGINSGSNAGKSLSKRCAKQSRRGWWLSYHPLPDDLSLEVGGILEWLQPSHRINHRTK